MPALARDPEIALGRRNPGALALTVDGSWRAPARAPDIDPLMASLRAQGGDDPPGVLVELAPTCEPGPLLAPFLYDLCITLELRGLQLDTSRLPEELAGLRKLAAGTATPGARPEVLSWRLTRLLTDFVDALGEACLGLLGFVGDLARALLRLVGGRGQLRWRDFRDAAYQCGPDALPIITLTSLLVGMILAYLGAVQLQRFGAEIYVADLVAIGMTREMAALMTAVVMAGRTGAAYAAQLGTMQANDEIDAIRTLGLSPIDFLVVPRMLALLLCMPLLVLYANLLGIIGGAIVAGGLGITSLQYFAEIAGVAEASHLFVGLFKSVLFAVLVALAGCRAGIESGRSSAAVGAATTTAVVRALVYLIIADAGVNILCQRLGW